MRKHIGISAYAAIISILVMVTLAIALPNQIDINQLPMTSVINIALDSLGCVIALILFYSCLHITERLNYSSWLFMMLLLANIVLLILDIVAWSVQGIASMRILNILANFFYYYGAVVLVALLWWYFRMNLGKEARGIKWMNIVLQICVIAEAILLLLNLKYGFFYTVDELGVYRRTSGSYFYSNVIPGVMLTLCLILVLSAKCTTKKKMNYCVYMLIPLLFVVLQDLFFGLSVMYVATLCAMTLLYADMQVQQTKELIAQQNLVAEQQTLLKEQQMKILMSQIQPHFLYNGMVSIRRLIIDQSPNAVAAMDHFIGYLRGSVDMLNEGGLIPLGKEVDFVRNYLEMEKVRFGEKIQYEIYLNEEGFLVPPISIQPIVENAVRHGIRKKEDGSGTITIETGRTDKEFFIEITDDGAGFDPSAEPTDERSHVGLVNVKERLETLCNGRMTIDSEIGKGTTVMMYISMGGNDADTDH